MKKLKSKSYIPHKKLNWDWTDKKRYLILYIILKFYVRHAMVVDKVHEIISIKQSKWLERYLNFNTQKKNQAVDDFEKYFYKLLNIAFFGKTKENVRHRCKIVFFYDKSFTIYGSQTFKQNEALMDKPFSSGFAILQLSKLHNFET